MAKKKQQESALFERTNEYRKWFCLRHDYKTYSDDREANREHEKRRSYMYQEKVGYCSNDAYCFRTEADLFAFMIRFG